jgi:hypothetical protein
MGLLVGAGDHPQRAQVPEEAKGIEENLRALEIACEQRQHGIDGTRSVCHNSRLRRYATT